MLKKKLLILTLLATFALVPVIRPASAGVEWWRWVSPVYEGHDDYLDANVVAYSGGSTAKILINIYNHLGVDAEWQVMVHMSWATSNVSSDEVDIAAGKYHAFELSIPIPATTTASNLYPHSYKIFYEYNYGSTINDVLAYSASNFAVYDADQAQIVDLRRELNAYPFYSPLMSKPKELFVKAGLEESIASLMYQKGDFASSKTHYQNALNYTSPAVSVDVEKTGSFEDSLLGVMDSLKNQMSLLGYGALMFGIGFMLIGIGVIIYAIRKPRAPAVS